MSSHLLVLGAGGHSRVLLDTLFLQANRVIGLVDKDRRKWGLKVLGVDVLGGDEVVENYGPNEVRLVNGVGSVKSLELRREVYERFKVKGYLFAKVLHPSAVIARDAELGEGVQVLAGAVLVTGARIGENSIVNTRASVDHDCIIGPHVQIAPGVTLSGVVRIGEGTHIGTGAAVIEGVTIGRNCLVGAGAVVVSDVPDGKTVSGVPARMR